MSSTCHLSAVHNHVPKLACRPTGLLAPLSEHFLFTVQVSELTSGNLAGFLWPHFALDGIASTHLCSVCMLFCSCCLCQGRVSPDPSVLRWDKGLGDAWSGLHCEHAHGLQQAFPGECDFWVGPLLFASLGRVIHSQGLAQSGACNVFNKLV